uniref:SCP domain-containing protein n=1 Tax=Strongyloides papillosus TaxID=174720 RepID=A0A0N5BMB8_STREA
MIRDHINLIRGYHRVETLRENAELDRLAQEHANQMAKQKKLFYVSSTYYGILVWASYYPAASVMVSKWYDERSRYNFLLNSPKPGTQHLTQMLWKNTKSVGIGIARDCDFLYAALYFYPKGNIRGQYRTNVFNKRSNCFGRK